MPNIRIMTWNIQKLSTNKTAIAGMANNIARVIVDANADIVLIQEATKLSGHAALTSISHQANALRAAAAGVAVDDYKLPFMSYYAGGRERYGVLIKNLNVVRPIVVDPPVPVPDPPPGAICNLISNLDKHKFITWPGQFVTVLNAYLGVAPTPLLPLTDIHATNPFRGSREWLRGIRYPCMAMFEVRGAAAVRHVIPIVICHLTSLMGGPGMTLDEIKKLKDLHISQKFKNYQDLYIPFGGYINLNGAATPIQELIIAGDFNLDFLSQGRTVRSAYFEVSTTQANQGSGLAAAQPGQPGVWSAPPPPQMQAVMAPGVPFWVNGNPLGPLSDAIGAPNLKTANTHQGTILNWYNAMVVPANLAALRGPAFDNFFFGGAQLSATYQNLTLIPAPADAAEVIDLPAQIVQAGGGGPNALDVSGAQNHYFFAGTHNAAAALNLAPGMPAAALTLNERLIGARFISDHLPVIVQFNLP